MITLDAITQTTAIKIYLPEIDNFIFSPPLMHANTYFYEVKTDVL